MTDKDFTASNGWTFNPPDKDGDISIRNPEDIIQTFIPPDAVNALYEYLQAERDTELGRWRDPENPDFVVYPGDGPKDWNIISEKDGVVFYTQDSDAKSVSNWIGFVVLRNYLKINPTGCKANTTVLGSRLGCAGDVGHYGIHYFEDADSGALTTWDGPDAV